MTLPPSIEPTQGITAGAQLLELSWITQGSVFKTQQGTWCWTRKVKAKTVTVALSAQQAELLNTENLKCSSPRCATSVKPSCSNLSQDPFAESDLNHPKHP